MVGMRRVGVGEVAALSQAVTSTVLPSKELRAFAAVVFFCCASASVTLEVVCELLPVLVAELVAFCELALLTADVVAEIELTLLNCEICDSIAVICA